MEIDILTYLEKLPVERRISEMMTERGKAYSIQGMANRLGINRETFRIMLSGKRGIYDFEMKQIADVLNVSVDRIKQQDVLDKRKTLHHLLQSPHSDEQSFQFAIELFEVAKGITEKCAALIDLGRAHYKVEQYERAHEIWLEAHQDALHIQEKYHEPQLLIHALYFLDISCSVRKDFSKINSAKVAEFLEEAALFQQKPQLAAYNRYFLARAAEEQGRFDEARENHYESIEYYLLSGHQASIGRAKLNTANFETRMGNFSKANALYEEALHDLTVADDLVIKILCLKEYGKCLILQGDLEKAVQTLHQATKEFGLSLDKKAMKYVPKINLLLARAQNDPHYAIQVLETENVDIKVKGIACRYLIDHYLKTDEPLEVVKYLKLSNELTDTQYDVLYEEDI